MRSRVSDLSLDSSDDDDDNVFVEPVKSRKITVTEDEPERTEPSYQQTTIVWKGWDYAKKETKIMSCKIT